MAGPCQWIPTRKFVLHSTEKNTISNPYYGKDCYTPKKIQSKYRVKKGELIGFVGNSGFSRGSHLHIEIKAEAKSKWEAMSYENSLPIPNIDTTFKLKKFIDPLKILSINSNLNRGFKINFWFYSQSIQKILKDIQREIY